jgi:ABC-type transporter Mla subunit MlaD
MEEPTELRFTLTFKDAQDLRPGQFVLYRGGRIGKVDAVDVDASGVKVNVTIDEAHRALVYKEANFTIEKLSMINPTGEHKVVMTDRGDVKTPVEEGTVIAGSEGWVTTVTDSVKDAANSAANAAAQLVGGKKETATPAPSSTTSH